MKVISHRGNLEGPNPERENEPEYINEAMEKIGWVEIDLWVSINKDTLHPTLYLGHDYPLHRIHSEFIKTKGDRLYVHCKNFNALEFCRNYNMGCNYFFHDKDTYTLVSNGEIWMYPSFGQFNRQTIMAIPERIKQPPEYFKGIGGVCTDFALEWDEREYG